MILSGKAKEVIKTTLAARFARGALRMLGTLVAGVAVLTLIALFPQEQADEGLNYCVGCASCLSTPRTKIESIV